MFGELDDYGGHVGAGTRKQEIGFLGFGFWVAKKWLSWRFHDDAAGLAAVLLLRGLPWLLVCFDGLNRSWRYAKHTHLDRTGSR